MALITTYNPLPVTFTHGENIWLYDKNHRAWLDAISGIGVCNLGHSHPEITRTITHQAEKLLHVSNTFRIAEQEELAMRLCKLCGMEQAFFCNSGAEANETAIKLARLYGQKKGITHPQIIVMDKSFHGRTLACLSASGNKQIQQGYDPLVPGFLSVPFNDWESVYQLSQSRSDIVAIMLEPIQGEGGIHLAHDDYLQALATLCDDKDWLLIMDEVQTGNARTGKLYAFMHTDVIPHIVTTAKGLGNGIPIGACLMRDKACNLFTPGSHGSTFGGNPFACTVALKVLDIIENQSICENSTAMGNLLLQKLEYLAGIFPIKSIRGKGLMIGIELDRPAEALKFSGLKQGILLSITATNVIRLLPPLIINGAQMEELVKRLTRCLEDFYGVDANKATSSP